jgi:hypothetical protein
MSFIHTFSAQQLPLVTRTIDNDAPLAMRNELVDAIFQPIEQSAPTQAMHFYRVILQSVGGRVAGDPYGGPRYACGRDLAILEWPRVYDVLIRLWPEFQRLNLQNIYRENINRVLDHHQVVWDMDTTGNLRRVTPAPVMAQVAEVFRELQIDLYAPAYAHLVLSRDAYDARPRNDLIVCSESFDALESAAKIRLQMPTATFGNVLDVCRQKTLFVPQVIDTLQQFWTLANSHFRHGMTEPFALGRAEVDYVYTSCLGGMLLFSRLT